MRLALQGEVNRKKLMVPLISRDKNVAEITKHGFTYLRAVIRG
jgi:hypothetical protein